MTEVVAPNKTLYVRNLDEAIKLPILKQELETLFSQFGPVLNVIAHKNLRMRGQAFVVFEDLPSAEKALSIVQDFPFHGKKIAVNYAKTQSDDTVKRERTDDEFERHKMRRLEVKGTEPTPPSRQTRLTGVERKKVELETRAKTKTQPLVAAAVKKPAPRPVQPIIPSTNLPPNKVLFLQNLPDSATKEELQGIYGRYPGFRAVRVVPGRKGIAFVDFDTESDAGTAKVSTSKLVMDGQQVLVTYQRKIV
jgi:U2 small nuclear ribonucleoprotein B''